MKATKLVLLTATSILMLGTAETSHAVNYGLHSAAEGREKLCGKEVADSLLPETPGNTLANPPNSPKDREYLDRVILRYRQIFNAYVVRNDEYVHSKAGEKILALRTATLPPCLSSDQSPAFVTARLRAAGIELQKLLKYETRFLQANTDTGAQDYDYYEGRHKLRNATAQLDYLSTTWTKALDNRSAYSMSKKDFKKEMDAMKPKFDDGEIAHSNQVIQSDQAETQNYVERRDANGNRVRTYISTQTAR